MRRGFSFLCLMQFVVCVGLVACAPLEKTPQTEASTEKEHKKLTTLDRENLLMQYDTEMAEARWHLKNKQYIEARRNISELYETLELLQDLISGPDYVYRQKEADALRLAVNEAYQRDERQRAEYQRRVELTVLMQREPHETVSTESVTPKPGTAEHRQLMIQKLVAQGDAHYRASEYRDAGKAYRAALKLAPGDEAIKRKVELAEIAAAKRSGDWSVDATGTQRQEMMKHKALKQYEQAMTYAREKLERKRFAEAMDGAAMARAVLVKHRTVFSVAEMEKLTEKAMQLTEEIKEKYQLEQLLQQERLKHVMHVHIRDLPVIRDSRPERMDEVYTMAIHYAYMGQKLRAVVLLNQVLLIDPHHQSALRVRELIESGRFYGPRI